MHAQVLQHTFKAKENVKPLNSMLCSVQCIAVQEVGNDVKHVQYVVCTTVCNVMTVLVCSVQCNAVQ